MIFHENRSVGAGVSPPVRVTLPAGNDTPVARPRSRDTCAAAGPVATGASLSSLPCPSPYLPNTSHP